MSFLEVEDLPQVRIAVRFFEIDRSKLLQYSTSFAVLGADFDQAPLLNSPTATALQGTGATQVGSVSNTDVRDVVGFLADGFTQEFQLSGDNFAVDAVMRLLETRGIARSLSRPTLSVLSGERASFQVGGTIPIAESFSPALGGGGAAGVFNTVSFESFGVSLQIRPLVEDDDRITLELQSQVSEPDATLTTLVEDTTGAGAPTLAFSQRLLTTNTRLQDGEALVLSGLAQSTRDVSESYVPFLNRIPLIGRFFERFSTLDDDLDLVVVVTPVVLREPIADLDLWVFPDPEELFSQTIDEFMETPAEESPEPSREGQER